MKRSDILAAIEVVVLVLAAIAAWCLPHAAFTYFDFAWFLAGLTVLKLSDVWLPRGDVVGLSAALALGALLLFDARFVLAALLIAGLLALVPPGRQKKLRPALSAVSMEAVATVVCSAVLVVVRLHPASHLLISDREPLRPEQYALLLLVGVLFAALEFGLLQGEMAFRDRRPIRASFLGSLSYGGWLIAAQSSAGVLAALMFRTMSAWGLFVSVIMILVMRQSFVLLLDIQQSYDATIGVLVKAMEAQSPEREGMAARNADLCVNVGRELGIHGRELARLRYAALLLGVGWSEDPSDGQQSSSKVIDGIDFLNDVAPILRVCDSPDQTAGVDRADLVCSYIVTAVAAATGTIRIDQLERMRDRISPKIIREVDAAVAAVLADERAIGITASRIA